jgi:hypothetical protein
MPKRTNDFQRLVYLVRVNLADGATVTESKMLEDRVTKTMREVDPPMLREIKKIHVQGSCQFQIEQFDMGSGRIGDVHVAWGKTEILGQDTLVVATKDSEGARKMSMNLAGSRRKE